MALKHRHVFVRGTVEDDLGPLLGEDSAQLVGVNDGYQRLANDDRGIDAQLLSQLEDAALVDIQKDKAPWVEPCDHAAQLRADRARRPRDQHGLAVDNFLRCADVDIALSPADQVVG